MLKFGEKSINIDIVINFSLGHYKSYKNLFERLEYLRCQKMKTYLEDLKIVTFNY